MKIGINLSRRLANWQVAKMVPLTTSRQLAGREDGMACLHYKPSVAHANSMAV
jgi:hypothetical protein